MKKELLIAILFGAGVVALLGGASGSWLFFGLLILACPFMMAFMHGGSHGSRDTSHAPDGKKSRHSH